VCYSADGVTPGTVAETTGHHGPRRGSPLPEV